MTQTLKPAFKVARNFAFALVLTAACAQSAQARPLEEYVQKTTEFSSPVQASDGSVTLQADLIFRHTRYFTDYRRVCNQIICGYDQVRRCDRYRCWYETYPRYCEVNCRMEPFTNSITDKIPSSCIARLSNADGTPVDKSKFSHFYLNSKTNSRFVQHVLHPELRDRKWGYMLNGLEATDKTLIIMKSKQYQIVGDQDFLQIPADFRAGDPVKINVVLEPNTTGEKFSTEGTAFDFPAFETVE